jgi:hypothetical protein
VPGGPTPADLPDAGAITPKVAEPGIPTTRPAPMNSLLAAATRLTGASLLASRTHRTGSAEQWQEDAWEMYDLVGELRFLATVIAATGAKARFYVGTLSDDPTDPPVPTEDQELIDALEAIGDGPSGLSQLVRRLLINLYVPGDGWLVGIPKALMPENRQEGAPPPARGDGVVILDDLVWRMLSVSEVKFESDDMILSLGVGKDQEVRARADDLYPIRVWNPHPRRSWEADSPTRSSLPVLRELVGLTMHISAQIDSRLAGAGIIIAPDSAARAARRAAGLPEDGPDDPFTDALIKAMMTPISDRANASAYVPLVWTVPDESAAIFRYLDQGDRMLDSQAKDMRDESIRRFALGADAPPELLLGVGSMNHWGAWIVKEDVVHTHLEPPLALVADAFTTQYLRPVMRQMNRNEEDIENTVVWFSVDHLIIAPNKGEDAKVAHEAGAINDKALRDAYGYSEDDAPQESLMSEARRVSLDMVRQHPSLMTDPGLDVIVKQMEALLSGAAIPVEEPEPVPPGLEQPQADDDAEADEQPDPDADDDADTEGGPPRRIERPDLDIAASARALLPV